MILIIDDSAGTSDVMRKGIGEKYNVKMASSAVIAVNIVTNEKIDLIIINVEMQTASGLSILKKIKSFQSQKDTPVIAILDDIKSVIAEECESLNAVTLLESNYDKNELLDMIKQFYGEPDSDVIEEEETVSESGKKIVLLVDDDVVALETLSFYLENDYEVQMAHSGTDAFDKMTTHKPDVILLDVRMPGMDGITFFKKMKSNPEFKSVPVIFQTGASDMDTVHECISIGPVGYIVKPVRKRILIDKINEALSSEKSLEHILIIEPDVIVCNIMKHHLQNNFKVSVESSISFALSFLGSQTPDLIIMDDENPCSSFYKIRAKQAEIPVILLSETCNDFEALDKCIALGAVGIIKNMYNQIEVMEMVKRALGK